MVAGSGAAAGPGGRASPPVDAALERVAPSRRNRSCTSLPRGISSRRRAAARRSCPTRHSRASRAAATSTAPHDGPPKMPSRKTSSRSAVSASRFETRYFASSSVGVEDLGDEPLVERAQALDLLAGQRLGGHDPDTGLVFAQVARHAHQRARRSRARRRRRRSPGSRRGSPGRSSRSAPAGSPGCRTGTA